MKVKLKLSQKQEDKILLAILLDGIDTSFIAIQELLEKPDLKPYQKTDLGDDLQYLHAAKIVYKWHSVDDSPLDKYEL